MKFFTNLSIKFKESWSPIGLIFVISGLLIGSALLLHFWQGVSFRSLTRDVTALAGLPIYYGFLSQIGIVFWAGTATVCLFGFRLCSSAVGYRSSKRFLLASALLTTLLGVDDLFLFHEVILPKYLGIPEAITFGIYGSLIALYFLRFYIVILRTNYIPLAVSLFFFLISILIDTGALSLAASYEGLCEDSAKLVGIVSWLVYYFGASRYIANRTNSADRIIVK